MAHEPSRSIEELFAEALQFKENERDAFIQSACGEDLAKYEKLKRLILAHVQAEGFLSPVEEDGDSTQAHSFAARLAEPAGTVVGPYRLLERIGEGGFGDVYLAEQREPVKRRVALKIIKLGMDTRQVVARFEAERQALAMMDHPNIATVFDAGATEEGRPYFVMEYVNGLAITDYCDSVNLPTTDRLKLFIAVCNAIQHAHQKGVIHRDVKPSNVLVTLHDGVPVPKVIDFGIAKAIDAELTEKTMFTQHRQMIGTPTYMSPEQAEMSGLDIDTRSDVYSLGVLLYELLTGTTPFTSEHLMQAGYGEIHRIIREEEPHKPSTRISTMGDQVTNVARQRQCDPRKLGTIVRGDLDWIVMRALEKDRTRRYETANGFAEDLVRHLQQEPVLAGPPTASYRFRKFARRHRTGLFTASAIVIIMVTSTIVSMIFAIQAESARERVEQLLLEVEALSDFFLVQVLDRANPESPRTKDFTLREALDEAAELVEEIENIAVRAKIEQQIGRIYYRIQLPEKARPFLESSLQLFEQHYGPSSEETAQSLIDLAQVLGDFGLHSEVQALQVRAMGIRESLWGPGHHLVADVEHDLGFGAYEQGDLDEAERFVEKAIAVYRVSEDEPDDRLSSALHTLGVIRRKMKHAEGAVEALRESLEIRKVLHGPEGLRTSDTMLLLGKILMSQPEHLVEGDQLIAEAARIRLAIFPDDSMRSAGSYQSISNTYARVGDWDRALIVLNKGIDIHLAKDGGASGSACEMLNTKGYVLHNLGRHDDARRTFEEALIANERFYEGREWHWHNTQYLFANLLIDLGEYDQASARLIPAYEAIMKAGIFDRAGRVAKVGISLGEARSSEDEVAVWTARMQQAESAEQNRLQERNESDGG